MKRFFAPVATFAIGSLLAGWMLLLLSNGLIYLLMTPLGFFFLLSFLAAMFQPHIAGMVKVLLAVPTTLMSIPLSILSVLQMGLRSGLFWAALAVMVWLACLFAAVLGARQRKKYAKVFGGDEV